MNHEDRDSESLFSTTILSQILICHDTYVDESGPPSHEQVIIVMSFFLLCPTNETVYRDGISDRKGSES